MPLSDAFEGLSHADRLALVFTALHDELVATSPPPPPSPRPTSPTNTSPQLSPSSTTRPDTPKATRVEPPVNDGKERRKRTSADIVDLNNLSTDGESVFPRHPGGEHGREDSDGEARAAREKRGERGQGEGEGQAEAETDRNRQGVEGGDRKDDGSGRGSEREGVGGLRAGNAESSSTRRPVETADAVDPGAASPANDGSEEESRVDNSRQRRRRQRQHRVIRGGVKASYVGTNVEALPVWGALDAIAGSSLLVDCRTPAQWRADEHRPTAQVVCLR